MSRDEPTGLALGGQSPTSPPDRRENMERVRQGQLPVLSDDEKGILKECERDSFFQRALPLSFGCMVGAQVMVKSGRWSPHPRFGALPKMIITGGIGYFVGKIMYLPMCQQKILDRLPHSTLAAQIRKAKGIPEVEAPIASWEVSPDDGNSGKSRVSDDYSVIEGLDDRNRPSMDREFKPECDRDEDSKPSVSYEDLRRRNRQEYEDKQAKRPQRNPGAPSYKDSEFMPQQPWPDRNRSREPPSRDDADLDSLPPQRPPPSEAPQKKKRTNMWGDPIE